MREMRTSSRMYKELLLLIFCLLIGCALPALTAALIGYRQPSHAALTDDARLVYDSHSEDCEPRTLTLRELLVGTLAAYNPSDTPIESLKAQAVALRSRACCLVGYCNGNARSLCDSPSHGLVYADRTRLTELFGQKEAQARLSAAEEAVNAVTNEVLCYGEEYALALTHASSSGQTKAMEGYPYLASVQTPETSAAGEIGGAEESGYGLSRAGAAVYAEQGLDYSEILAHYFPGTVLTVLQSR